VTVRTNPESKHEKGNGATYVKVQAVRVDHVVIDHLDVESGVQVLHQIPQLRASNTIGTVNGQRTLDLDALHDLLEGGSELLIVALFRGLTILVLCTESILAAHDIVELRSGHVLEVDELDLGSGQSSAEDAYQTGSRGTGIASEDHTGGVGHLNVDLLDKLIVDIGDLIKRGICQPGCILFPLGLNIMVSSAFQFRGRRTGISYFEHLTLH
jgi:hypothetical protein